MATYYNPSQSSELSFVVAEADLYLPTRVSANLARPTVKPGTAEDTQTITGVVEYQQNGVWYAMSQCTVRIEVLKPGSTTWQILGSFYIPGGGIFAYIFNWKPTEVGTHRVRVSYAGTAPTGELYGAYPSYTEVMVNAY